LQASAALPKCRCSPSARACDDFEQAGELYRLMPPDAKDRIVATIAGSLAQVSDEGIRSRSIEHFTRADPDYGARIAKLIDEVRGSPSR